MGLLLAFRGIRSTRLTGETYGPKEVCVMRFAGGLDADGVAARLGLSEANGGFHRRMQEEFNALPMMDYNQAFAYREELIRQAEFEPNTQKETRISVNSSHTGYNCRRRLLTIPSYPNTIYPVWSEMSTRSTFLLSSLACRLELLQTAKGPHS